MISFWTMMLRLCVALLLGALIGLERQTNSQPAGLRTNALVALGTCLFMLLSAYGFSEFLTLPHIQLDPSRIASYVVAGIGFLGAGAIYRSQSAGRVKGLTTAAAIWVVAAIGLACGLGLLLEAAVTTALALVTLVGLRYLEELFAGRQAKPLQHFSIEAATISGTLLEELYDACVHSGVTLEKIKVRTREDGVSIEIACLVTDLTLVNRLVGAIHALAGVREVHTDLGANRRAKELGLYLDEGD